MVDPQETSPKSDASAFRPFLREPVLSKEQIESLRASESSRQRGISPAITFAYVVHKLEVFAAINKRPRLANGLLDVSAEEFRESTEKAAKELGVDRRTIASHFATLATSGLLQTRGTDKYQIQHYVLTDDGERLRAGEFRPIPLVMFRDKRLSFRDLQVYGSILKHSGRTSEDTSKHGVCRFGAMKIAKEICPECKAAAQHVTKSLRKLAAL